MDIGAILEAIWAFIQASGIITILGLILLDIVLGIAEALKKGVFEWEKVWNFLRSMILPDLLGYIALLAFIEFLPDGVLDGWLPDGITALIFTAICGRLLTSIVAHAKYLWTWLRGANGEP